MRGLEPPTFGLRIRYSAKLSYIPIMVRLRRIELPNPLIKNQVPYHLATGVYRIRYIT